MPTQVKSNYVGRAIDGTASVTTAYRAVIALECVECTGAIGPGHLFSRRSQPVARRMIGALTLAPVCLACRPLRMQDR
jgi:integral membrane sensor domain MASE1